MSSSLSASVSHAVAYLSRPLFSTYAPDVVVKLQLVLEANLTALYAQTWDVTNPLRGSGRRCLTLSPDCLPPRAVYSACVAAGVQWFDWISLLDGRGRGFDFFVDPGCVSMRLDPKAELITIWADEIPSPIVSSKRPTVFGELQVQPRSKKTLAQQLLEEDSESDDQIFTMIADQVCAPTWLTPALAEFPKPRSLSPLSAISSHSRSSSRSSNSSSGRSFSSVDSVPSQSSDENGHSRQSRRERARQARVYVDTSKTEVTPYDGGKTTVLTGGVMLGGGPKKAAPREVNGWRSAMRI